jgi:hypothetical protein
VNAANVNEVTQVVNLLLDKPAVGSKPGSPPHASP